MGIESNPALPAASVARATTTSRTAAPLRCSGPRRGITRQSVRRRFTVTFFGPRRRCPVSNTPYTFGHPVGRRAEVPASQAVDITIPPVPRTCTTPRKPSNTPTGTARPRWVPTREGRRRFKGGLGGTNCPALAPPSVTRARRAASNYDRADYGLMGVRATETSRRPSPPRRHQDAQRQVLAVRGS